MARVELALDLGGQPQGDCLRHGESGRRGGRRKLEKTKQDMFRPKVGMPESLRPALRGRHREARRGFEVSPPAANPRGHR